MDNRELLIDNAALSAVAGIMWNRGYKHIDFGWKPDGRGRKRVVCSKETYGINEIDVYYCTEEIDESVYLCMEIDGIELLPYMELNLDYTE